MRGQQRTNFCAFMLIMVMSLFICTSYSMNSFANELGGDSSNATTEGNSSGDDNALIDYINGQQGLTANNLNKANQTLTPFKSLIGNITGGILVLVFICVFAMTALDLLYITVPPLRGIMYKGDQGGQMGGMPGMGMQGGYGMRSGYGMQSQMGGQSAPTHSLQLISDEAKYCVMMLSGGGQQGMNTPMGMPQQQQPMPMKSVIGEYFKKRVIFMILLAVSAIVLTSSVLLGTGVNLAKYFLKILEMFNKKVV